MSSIVIFASLLNAVIVGERKHCFQDDEMTAPIHKQEPSAM